MTSQAVFILLTPYYIRYYTPGVLEYESDVHVPTENESSGNAVSFGVGTKTNGSFLPFGLPKWGSFSVKKRENFV